MKSLAIKSIEEIPSDIQGLFDLIFTKLNAQQALGFSEGMCDYRVISPVEEDRYDCCAIGMLIPDDLALDVLMNFDGIGFYSMHRDIVFIKNPDGQAWAEKVHPNADFLASCQTMHDQMAKESIYPPADRKEKFDARLVRMETEYGIDTTHIRSLDWSWYTEDNY